MTTWARTLEGDLYLPPNGEGAEAIVRDPAAAMAIKIPSVLQFVRGEWVLDTSEGFPWLPILTQKNPSIDVVRAQLRAAVLAIPGVASVVDLAVTFDRTTRSLRYQGQARLTSGQVVPFG